MGLIDGLITFVVGVLVGGVGIYVGGLLIAGEGTFGRAITVALVGALVWAMPEAFIGWIPFVGPLLGAVLALVVYLLVLNLSYSGGWTEAAGIAVVAWITVVAVRVLLGPIGFGLVPGIGVPGV